MSCPAIYWNDHDEDAALNTLLPSDSGLLPSLVHRLKLRIYA
ncbi:hypothetical protein [[Limnothrix rosea] IAM M-220]|nr:hypothetical protein [[Limnothrix rosea] IAM M-220]